MSKLPKSASGFRRENSGQLSMSILRPLDHDASLPPPPGPPLSPPTRPAVLKAALALYIIASVLGLLTVIISGGPSPDLPDAPPGAVVLLVAVGCFALLVLAVADIVSAVAAYCGYAWGAIVQILLFVPSLILWLVDIGMHPQSAYLAAYLAVAGRILGIASLVCFILPESWTYYKECAHYRRAKASVAMPCRY